MCYGLCGKQRLLLPILCGQPVALRLIVVLHRGGGVQDGGAQIGHDVLDGLGGVGHHIEDVLNVLAGQLVQPQPDGFGGLRLLADVLGLPRTAVHLHNVVQQFLQLVGVVPLGKYGRMRLAYLKTQRPVLYHQMLLNGTLWPHLQDAQKTACAWLERTMTTLLDKYPAPDKERAQLLWVAHMNGLKAQAEEVVVREVVYAE